MTRLPKTFIFLIQNLGVGFIAALLVCVFTSKIQAQSNTSFTAYDDFYIRILQISGVTDDEASYHLRPYLNNQIGDIDHPLKDWYDRRGDKKEEKKAINIFFHEPVLFQSYNTGLPRGANDGPVWQGRGYNSAFTFGASGSAGPIYWKLQPAVGFAQNQAYDLAPYEPFNNQIYNYRLTKIDYVQRYGPDTYQWADLGESYLEARFLGIRTGLSNEKVWIGPAVYNPLLFGYNAPGFLHGHISSDGPISTPIGNFEFSYLYGAFKVSDYFDGVQVNRFNVRSELTSVKNLMISYSPSFAKGLSLGASRVFQERWPSSWKDIGSDIFKVFESFSKIKLATVDNPSGASPDNQMMTVFARWVFPQRGIEFYGEFGRNDHNFNMRDFRALPNHHRAYMLGLTKTFHLSESRLLAVNFELNQHEPPRSANILGGTELSWHPHGAQVQGFTNRGQLVATEFTPGNNAQSFSAILFEQKKSLGIRLVRVEHHNSRYFGELEVVQEFNNRTAETINFRTVEFIFGLEYATEFRPGLQVSFTLDQSFIMNQHHIYNNDEFNTRFGVMIRKNIPGFLR